MVRKKIESQSVLIELNSMLEQVEDAETKKNKLLGRQEEKKLQMERELGFSSIKEAENRINTLDHTITKRSSSIFKRLEIIKEQYDFEQA